MPPETLLIVDYFISIIKNENYTFMTGQLR